jgi:hypothetical protein
MTDDPLRRCVQHQDDTKEAYRLAAKLRLPRQWVREVYGL